jgi:hypothetical protein
VLFNGVPPASLPRTILDHELYIRSFGNRDFQTCISKDGVLQTTTRFGDRKVIFEFFLGSNSNLTVKEIDIEKEIILELLDPEGAWAAELPVRLRKLFSHWVCRNNDDLAIILRPIDFEVCHVEFVMFHRGGSWTCFQVPTHERILFLLNDRFQIIWADFRKGLNEGSVLCNWDR